MLKHGKNKLIACNCERMLARNGGHFTGQWSRKVGCWRKHDP